MELGALKADFPYSLNWIAGCIKQHQDMCIFTTKAIQR